MHCVLRNTLCTTSSVSERGDVDSENQCRDPEHRITLREINSIKNDNIDVDIINKDIVFAALKSGECHLVINILIT